MPTAFGAPRPPKNSSKKSTKKVANTPVSNAAANKMMQLSRWQRESMEKGKQGKMPKGPMLGSRNARLGYANALVKSDMERASSGVGKRIVPSKKKAAPKYRAKLK